MALAVPMLVVLALFGLLRGQLPWLGHFEWIGDARPETGLAWVAPLRDATLDEDGRILDVALFEWRPDASGAWLCRLAGPAFAQDPAGSCARHWHMLGPAHQPHDSIRAQGGGGFSVWHGTLYFSIPDHGDPRAPDRRFALWLPWRVGADAVAGFAAAALLWAVWPLTAPARRHPRLLLTGFGLAIAGMAALAGGMIAALAWAGLLLAALQTLRYRRHRGLPAAVLVLAGFLMAEAGLSAAIAALGLVPDLQTVRMLKYLVDLDTDRPILLLVGSSYSQYGIDEAALETALDAAGHHVTVARLGFGGFSIPERLHYIRRYLAAAKHKPAAVLFEISAYYELQPLKQLEQNPGARREIAAMDVDNLRLSLDWALGPDGDPSKRLKLTAELLGQFALSALNIGFLPNSTEFATLRADDFSGTPQKTQHFGDARIAADLAMGQDNRILLSGLIVPGTGEAIPTRWARAAIDEELTLLRTAGVSRFGFYAPPSRYADEPIYARQFCRTMRDYACLAADDAPLIAALGHDADWLDATHLYGPGRQAYTAWLATHLADAGVLP